MTLLPRSLFGRLVLLLVAVVALAVLTSIVMFRHDRAELLVRQFSDTKLAQLQALRAALESADGPHRRETLQRLNREYGVRIVPEERAPQHRPARRSVRCSPISRSACARTWARTPKCASRRALRLLLVRVNAGGEGYWVGFPMPDRAAGARISRRAR